MKRPSPTDPREIRPAHGSELSADSGEPHDATPLTRPHDHPADSPIDSDGLVRPPMKEEDRADPISSEPVDNSPEGAEERNEPSAVP